jgi:hypothetical protein
MEFAERLRGELSGLLDVIHRAGGGVVFEEFPGALEEDTRGAEPVDGESSAARRALIEEANKVAETLERLRHEETRRRSSYSLLGLLTIDAPTSRSSRLVSEGHS